MIGLRTLAAGKTVEIDVKAIRDAQIPDETGKVLPMDTTRGQIRWTVRARMENEGAEVPDNLGMIGQSEQHDTARGMNTSYYCENCCPGSYDGSIIVPGDSEIAFESGKTIAYKHFELHDDCYGGNYQFETTSQVSWSSTLTSVAVTNGNVVTVIGAGEAQIKATFSATSWAAIPCPPGEEPPYAVGNTEDADETGFFSTFRRRPRGPSAEEDLIFVHPLYNRASTRRSTSAPALFLPTCGTCVSAHSTVSPSVQLKVRPVITGQTPSRGLIGNSVEVIINGRGFDSTASVFAGVGITVSNITVNSNTKITSNFVMADDAPRGNHAVTVTVQGKTSSGNNFFVQAPARLVLHPVPGTTNGVGPLQTPIDANVVNLSGDILKMHHTGVYRNYGFILVDQEGQRILQGFQLNEGFSEYCGTETTLPPAVESQIPPGKFVTDIHSFTVTHPAIVPSNRFDCFDQSFIVPIGGTNWGLLSIFHIEVGNFSGQLKADLSVVQ